MNKLKSINWGFAVSITLWSLITLSMVFHHSPWYDEAHAWTIAQELNIFEIFRFMRTEGHTFFWYLLLMPFAKTNFMYPYSMLLLNWFFCFVALLIMWKKSPFNNWVKFVISFSYPFLGLYPVVARCYSIGIMILFILISMDKDKFKHPNWYSFLLILLANTSLMGAVPAAALGLIFAYEMVKHKQNLVAPFSIAIGGAILILVQLCGSVDTGLTVFDSRLTLIEKCIVGLKFNVFYYTLFVAFLSSIFAIIFYIKNKIFPRFLVLSFVLIFSLFSVYAGSIWHWFWGYINFVASCWLILYKDNLDNKKLISISLFIISLFFVFFKPTPTDSYALYGDRKVEIAKDVLKDKNLEHATIFIMRAFDASLQPLLKGSDIKLVNYCSNDILNYDTMSYNLSKNCKLDMYWDNQELKLDKEVFDKWYGDNLYVMTLSRVKFDTDKSLGYKFVLYKEYGTNYLWKIEKIK